MGRPPAAFPCAGSRREPSPVLKPEFRGRALFPGSGGVYLARTNEDAAIRRTEPASATILTTVGRHWATAPLVIPLWVVGQLADLAPKGPLRTDVWSVHFTLGFALAIVLVCASSGGRRAASAFRRPIPASSGLSSLKLPITAVSPYLATVALGLVNAFVRGVSLFDLTSLPQIGDPALKRPVTDWHELAANLTLGLANLPRGGGARASLFAQGRRPAGAWRLPVPCCLSAPPPLFAHLCDTRRDENNSNLYYFGQAPSRRASRRAKPKEPQDRRENTRKQIRAGATGMAKRTGEHYDSTTIGLHWVTALMVVVLWGGGQLADFVPKGVWRTNGWTLHVALGFALLTVLIWRFVWRFTGRRRLPAADANPAVHLVAEASHYALYALLFATVALGVADAFARGFSLHRSFEPAGLRRQRAAERARAPAWRRGRSPDDRRLRPRGGGAGASLHSERQRIGAHGAERHPAAGAAESRDA